MGSGARKRKQREKKRTQKNNQRERYKASLKPKHFKLITMIFKVIILLPLIILMIAQVVPQAGDWVHLNVGFLNLIYIQLFIFLVLKVILISIKLLIYDK